MAGKRSYVDGCASAHALDLVGERWALLVVRELMLGPKRFTDLRRGLPGISPNVLTARLEQLESAAVVRRRRLPPPAAASVYELTEWGLELEPAIQALGRWAARSPSLPDDAPMSVDAFILSLRTMFDPAAAGSLSGCLELHVGTDSFVATFDGGAMTIVRGSDAGADARLAGDVEAWLGVVYGGVTMAAAIADGTMRVSGDKRLARRFLALCPLPSTAPAYTGP